MADEQDPTLADRWAALQASPVGQAAGYVADAAKPLTNEIGAMGNNAVDLAQGVGSGINNLTGGAFAPSGPQSAAPPPGAAPPPPPAPPQVGPPLPPGMGPQGAPPAVPPSPPEQAHAAIMQAAAKHGDQYTADGLIDGQTLLNDKAVLALDTATQQRYADAIKAANDHKLAMDALGKKAAADASGKDYWENASTGGKIARVLLGIVTLGGSEKYIAAHIQKQVAIDQTLKDNENNAYAEALAMGKTKEEAAQIDLAKQNHIYQLGLHRIAADHPSPVIQQKAAALLAGVNKEVSTAQFGLYKQQQENAVAQQNAGSTRMNAVTERMKADAERGKAGTPTILRDSSGNVIGHTDTPDQAKQIQAQQLSVEGLDRLAEHVKSYSWTDKFTPSARAAAAADYSQAMQLVNTYRAAHPNEESSRQMEVLGKSIPNPSELTTSPGAYRTGFNELLNQMKLSLVASKKQSGI